MSFRNSRLWFPGEWILGLGVGQLSMTLLAVLDISLGPADPLAVPESFSPALTLAWFVGFAAIAIMGCTFFIARPTLEIAKRVYAPLYRILGPWSLVIAACLGLALGLGAEALLHSAAARDFAVWSNDPKALVVLIEVPLLLAGIASALRRS